MINYKAIGRRIACYRKKLSMTQATLSEELNVSESYVSQVERGSAKVSLTRLDEISEVLEQLMSLMNTYIAQQKLLSPIIVINDNEQKIVSAKDILYLEADGKYCTIRTATDTYHSSKTLAQVHALLPQHCFYRTHKSYVINLYCVDSFDKKCITTTNNEKVLVGGNKMAEFKRVYANFIKNYYLRT